MLRKRHKGRTRGIKHRLAGFLGYVAIKSKECLNHAKLCKLSNMALKRNKLSFKDAMLDETHRRSNETTKSEQSIRTPRLMG